MYSLADLPGSVPLFPLAGALLLPRTKLPLHVFEPRYLAMFDDAFRSGERMIGMVQPIDGGSEGALHKVGCAGRIVAFNETDDRRYMVTLKGICRFRLGSVEEGFTPYMKTPAGWEDFAGDLGKPARDKGLNREKFFGLLARYFEHASLQTDWESMREADDEMLIDALSMTLPLPPEDKQALLEAPTLTARRETMETLLEFSLHASGGEREERWQ